jgi:hypothetical protein
MMRKKLLAVVMVTLSLVCISDAAWAKGPKRSEIYQSAQRVVLSGALQNHLVPIGTTCQQVAVKLPRALSAVLPRPDGQRMKMHPSVPYTIRSTNGRVLSQGNVALGITRTGSAALYRYPTGRR